MFVQLSLAFRNDSYTLESRINQAERERNLTEEDTEKELENFKASITVTGEADSGVLVGGTVPRALPKVVLLSVPHRVSETDRVLLRQLGGAEVAILKAGYPRAAGKTSEPLQGSFWEGAGWPTCDFCIQAGQL